MIRALVVLVVLSACAASQDMSPELLHSKVQKRLKSLAGENALDCGDVAVKASTERANDCARHAFRKGKPFYVIYENEGIDSEGSAAVAMDAAKRLYWINSDSMGFSGPYRAGTMVEEGNHILVEPCPKPYRLNVDRLKQLTCLPMHHSPIH